MTRSVVLAVLALLLTVSQASGGCAWVLWQQTITPIEDWQIFDARPTRKECAAWLLEYGRTMKRQGYHVSGIPDSPPSSRNWEISMPVNFRKGDEAGTLFCLADTVDPRGPKGSER